MCDSASDFSSVRVGDKLWSVQLGECEVSLVDDDGTFFCENADDGSWYCVYGACTSNDDHGTHQSLFWSRPEIIAPPRPKRKVVRTVRIKGRICDNGEWIIADVSSFPYRSMSGSEWHDVTLTGTYEVFE